METDIKSRLTFIKYHYSILSHIYIENIFDNSRVYSCVGMIKNQLTEIDIACEVSLKPLIDIGLRCCNDFILESDKKTKNFDLINKCLTEVLDSTSKLLDKCGVDIFSEKD